MPPQFFLLYTCLEKQHIAMSCYKLMFIVCICDMLNLTTCLLSAGIFTLFGIQHCNSGIWVIYYGQLVMFLWYAYCIANLILAFNRVLEFLSRRMTEFLFDGRRSWFWVFVVIAYALSLCLLSPHPFYFYNSEAGVWYFFWLLPDPTNYAHVYNNMIKLGLMVGCYVTMLALLRRKMAASQSVVSDLQIRASIIAMACAAGNITYVVISYLPMGNSPFTGNLGETLWGLQHSAAGFVYMVMNKAVRKNISRFLSNIGCKSLGASVVSVSVIKPAETTILSCGIMDDDPAGPRRLNGCSHHASPLVVAHVDQLDGGLDASWCDRVVAGLLAPLISSDKISWMPSKPSEA
uniref:7TM_GPCR_Srx domain-containing protein n=1 Tax=Steinernema glaseri TaxID=37863 RepID=A0A1I7YV03_9BILA